MNFHNQITYFHFYKIVQGVPIWLVYINPPGDKCKLLFVLYAFPNERFN